MVLCRLGMWCDICGATGTQISPNRLHPITTKYPMETVLSSRHSGLAKKQLPILSADASRLAADPRSIDIVEIAFLNGQRDKALLFQRG